MYFRPGRDTLALWLRWGGQQCNRIGGENVPASKGSRNNGDTGRYASLAPSTDGGAVSYGGVGGDVLRDAVQSVTSNGDAILFGRTSDGGALTVQVLSGGKSVKWYPGDISELYELLEGLTRLENA